MSGILGPPPPPPPPNHQAKRLFETYSTLDVSSNVLVLTRHHLRLLLLALFAASREYPPFAVDEAVTAVLNEIQLQRVGRSVSWIEFKSYCLYLHQTPLADLVHVAVAASPAPDAMRTRALYVERLPVDLEYAANDVVQWASVAGQMERIFWHQPTGQAVVLLQTAV